jgi:hypothetical protein
MKTPNTPQCEETRQAVEFAIWFRSVSGFIAKYEELLPLYGSPYAAYEATERLYVIWFTERRYEDKDVFYPVLSRYRRERNYESIRLAA